MNTTNEWVIETRNLDYSFRGRQAVLRQLNLRVERGAVYGFLGPNGAGKTTTIRLLMGLLRDRRHAVLLFGKQLSEHRMAILPRIGSLIEQPSLYEQLTGADNMEVARRVRKISRIDASRTLAMAGLSDAAGKRVKDYSLGMKQRLGLAMAFLGKPELLILDEPVNGLDPGGMAEIRDLLLAFNRDLGTTLFLSSHLLAEIEKMATHVGIIHQGALRFQGTIRELRDSGQLEPIWILKTSDDARALVILREHFHVSQGDAVLRVKFRTAPQAAGMVRELVGHGLDIYALTEESGNLERLFLQWTEDRGPGAVPEPA